jgi:hypothetical protein
MSSELQWYLIGVAFYFGLHVQECRSRSWWKGGFGSSSIDSETLKQAQQSDPYVRVQVNNVTKGRTEVVNNGMFTFLCSGGLVDDHNNTDLNPRWEQYVYIPGKYIIK